jgi:hypothetical protein
MEALTFNIASSGQTCFSHLSSFHKVFHTRHPHQDRRAFIEVRHSPFHHNSFTHHNILSLERCGCFQQDACIPSSIGLHLVGQTYSLLMRIDAIEDERPYLSSQILVVQWFTITQPHTRITANFISIPHAVSPCFHRAPLC